MLYATFTKEREAAVRVAEAGGVSESEQLVWVLYKILRGEGNDVSLRSAPAIFDVRLGVNLRCDLPDRSVLAEHASKVATASKTPSGKPRVGR